MVAGWNLIGYSAGNNISVADLKFTNNSGSSYTWANAVANNKVQAYLAYFDNSPASLSARKFKYVATSDLGMDSSSLMPNVGYWLYANQSGNLTLPSVGGSYSNETYRWSKLRFKNSTGSEKNITDAGSIGQALNWIETTFQYSNTGNGAFKFISDQEEDINYISSWRGVWIKSLKENITLIRQN